MSNLDTRLRETLDQVAESTKVRRRVDEIVAVRQRRPVPKLAVAMAAFASVVAVFTIPMFLGGSSGSDLAGGFAPTTPGTGGTPPETSVTVDPAWLTVEPEDVAVFQDMPLPGDGERAPLRTETIWCFYEDFRPIETFVAGVAVDQPVTAELLVSSCANHPEVANDDGQPAAVGTVCRGVLADSAYQEFATAGEWDITPEEIARPKPGFPVILTWESDCVSEIVQSSTPINLTADLSIDSVNRARELELAVRGASLRNCLSNRQADALTDAVVSELGADWMREPVAAGAAISTEENLASCFQPFIDQQWGFVFYAEVRDAPSTPGTETTTDPTG